MTRIAFTLFTTALAAIAAAAAPPLVLIEDTLYKADGTKFAGTAEISWPTFQALDNSHVASHAVTVRIVEGALRVRLVPTAEAIPGVVYTVRYQSDGRNAFVETWAVPSTSAKLRIKDVRVVRASSSTPVTPPNSNVEITDVLGLADALGVRPMRGLSFMAGRAVITDESGALVTADGTGDDCVRADGTVGPCGSGSALPLFVDLEAPAGTVNGVNMVFTLSATPSPVSSLHLYRNGLLQSPGVDFNITGATISFVAAATPQTGDILLASFRGVQ